MSCKVRHPCYSGLTWGEGCDCSVRWCLMGSWTAHLGGYCNLLSFSSSSLVLSSPETPLLSPLQPGPAMLYLTKCCNSSHIKTMCLATPRRLRDFFPLPSADSSLVIPLAGRAVTELWGPAHASYTSTAIKVSLCCPPSSAGSSNFYPDAKAGQVNRKEIGL